MTLKNININIKIYIDISNNNNNNNEKFNIFSILEDSYIYFIIILIK